MAASGTFALGAWLAPGIAFLILSLAVPLRRSGRPAAAVPIVFSLGALLAAVWSWRLAVPDVARRVLWDWIPVEDAVLTSVGVLADADSALMLILVALISFLVQVYSVGYLSDEPPASLGRYYAYQSLFAFSMMGLVLAPNLVQLFICWELVGLCSYLLIGYWYQRPEAARAAVKAFWITQAGGVFFLIGIVMLWSRTGTFDFSELFEMARAGSEVLTGLGLVTFFIYLGAAGKSAQFPFHIWLPDAIEGPTPVSALIHAATMVTAGVYLLFRTAFLFEQTPDVLAAVGWNGAFTALLAPPLAAGPARTPPRRAGVRAARHQARARLLDRLAAGLHDGGDRSRVCERRVPAPAHPRRVQGAALPRRGGGHPRGGQQRHLRDGRARTTHAADVGGVPDRPAVPRGHALLRGLLFQGGDPGLDLRGRPHHPVRDAGTGRVPHRLLHVPGGVHRLLRRPRPRRPCPRPARRHGRAPLDPGRAGHGHRPRAAAGLECRAGTGPAGPAGRGGHRGGGGRSQGGGVPGSWNVGPDLAPPGWLAGVAIAVAVAGIVLAWLVYGRRLISAD